MIWGSFESTGPKQHTGTSLVFIRCVVPEIEIFSLFQSGKTAFLEMELFFSGENRENREGTGNGVWKDMLPV